MVTDGEALTALLLEKETLELGVKETAPDDDVKTRAKADRIFEITGAWLEDYFAGKKMPNPVRSSTEKSGKNDKGNGGASTYTIKVGRKEILLRPEGCRAAGDAGLRVTPFRQKVWECLCEIPYGETVSYGDIAKRLAAVGGKTADRGKTAGGGKKKMSAQAVGGAVGHNPISIIIPCHRVIGASGNLVGYGGGMPVKVKLLEHEGLDINQFIIPTKGTKI